MEIDKDYVKQEILTIPGMREAIRNQNFDEAFRLCRSTKTDLWRENCAISATMLQLSIVAHGLASCWVLVGGRPRLKDVPEGEKADDYLKSFLTIPENCEIECVVALGYSDFEPKPLPEWDAEATVSWHK